MATRLADAAAEPAQVSLADGTVVTVYPLTLIHLTHWERGMKEAVVNNVRASFRTHRAISEIEIRVAMSEAVRAAAAISFSTELGQQFLQSLEGMQLAVYLSMAQNPVLKGQSLEKVLAPLNGFEDLAEVAKRVMDISGLGNEEDDAEADPTPGDGVTSNSESGSRENQTSPPSSEASPS